MGGVMERFISRQADAALPVLLGFIFLFGMLWALFMIPGIIVINAAKGLHQVYPSIPGHVSDHAAYRVSQVTWGCILAAVFIRHVVKHNNDWYKQQRAPSASHGSAAWGRTESLWTVDGLILGRRMRPVIPTGIGVPKPKTGSGRAGQPLLRLAGEGHALTFGSTGSGKGVSSVIPNLLDHPGSVLVTDPKGENTIITAGARARMGQKVIVVDPFQIVGGQGSFNPLEGMDAYAPAAYDEAVVLADLLVVPEGSRSYDPFWEEEARAFLTGLILYVRAHESIANLGRLLELKSQPARGFREMLEKMQASQAGHGAVARTANDFLKKSDREQSGVLSQVSSQLHFLESPRIRTVLSHSSFDFTELKTSRVSIYLVLPTERLEVHRRWLRLMVGCAAHAVTTTPGAPEPRVLFLLDEFPNLGPLKPVEQAVTILRGYGARFWLLAQDLPKLKSVYPRSWETFLGQCAAVQAFGVNDLFTANYLSDLAGHATVEVTSTQKGAGSTWQPGTYFFPSTHSRSGTTVSEVGRKLIFPDEIRRLPPTQELLLLGGQNAIVADRVNYLRDPEFVGRFAGNPRYPVIAAPAVAAPKRGMRERLRQILPVSRADRSDSAGRVNDPPLQAVGVVSLADRSRATSGDQPTPPAA